MKTDLPISLIEECARSGQMGASQVHQHAQAGELRAEDFTTVQSTLHRLMQEIADEAARSDVECTALGVPSHLSMPLYDINHLEPELPTDDDIRDSYRQALGKSVRYLELRGLLERPVAGQPNLVCFEARRG